MITKQKLRNILRKSFEHGKNDTGETRMFEIIEIWIEDIFE